MPLSKLRPTFTLTEDRLQELQAVVPEAFADGKIDWEALQTALGEYLEDPAAEHFGLTWPGKREARRLAALPPQGALLPQPGLGVNEDTTHNLFIEADNLEALKLLLKAYAGRVKLIYIDPPYNTGNDFVYPDDYSQPLEAYLRQTGQADEQGRRLTSNTRAGGRFHSSWLSMMYPRLLLARQLLSEDGVIFISIDDNEVHNLRQVMQEIFGEENFVAQIIVQTNKGGQDYLAIAKTHEYLLCYVKDFEKDGLFDLPKTDFTFPYKDTRGEYETRELRNRNPKFNRQNRPNLYYPFYVNPSITDAFGYSSVSLERSPEYQLEVYPKNSLGEDSCWRWGRSRSSMNITSDNPTESQIVAKQTRNGGWNIYEKSRISTQKAKTIWDETDVRTEAGTKEVRELMDAAVFDHPKPVYLLKKAAMLGAPEGYILDFFSGSGTIAQAMLEMNREDGGSRQFILVQLPEPTPPESVARKAGYATIADIGRERIRRVIQRMQKEPPTLTSGGADLGFRSFKLGRSHFTPWQPQAASQPAQLELQLQTAAGPLQPGWQPADLLPEILLIEGFPLDSQVRPLPAYPENQVVEVSHDFCAHRLTICLDETLSAATLAALLQLHPEDTFICLDSALDDESKLRLADRCNLKVI